MKSYEKIIKRDDGTRVKISVNFYVDFCERSSVYSVDVFTCKPRKRTWVDCVNTDDYSYRRRSMDEREEFKRKERYKYVSQSEVDEARLEMWQTLKPKGL